jgi:hypothetical protein
MLLVMKADTGGRLGGTDEFKIWWENLKKDTTVSPSSS